MQLEMEERDLQKMATLSRNDEKLDQLQAELDAINKVAEPVFSTVQSLCNTDLDITQSYCAPKYFYRGILQRNYLSGRVLDSRPKGRGLEPHCVVSLSKNINPSLVLVLPRKTYAFITERLLMGRKESNQTNKQTKEL